jgi:hypothetical protein
MRRPVLTVPGNKIAVLGDNSKVSEDSRAFGPVPIQAVLGLVVAAPKAPPAGSNPTLRPHIGGWRHNGLAAHYAAPRGAPGRPGLVGTEALRSTGNSPAD